MSRSRLAVIVAALAAVMALAGPAAAATPPEADGYALHDVPEAAVPYWDGPMMPRQLIGTVDESGVRMYQHPTLTGGEKVDHPVGQAQYGLHLLNTYRATGDPWFLEIAQRQGRRLVDTHVESRGAWWFPYSFDFALGGSPDNVLEAPWYSAMAQGQVLSLFVRLHEADGDPQWRAAADATFLSLGLPVDDTEPWAVWVDGSGYLWLEEYPKLPLEQSERVLNGHVFAMYGLWDYWRLTGSDDAVRIFDAAATTVVRYVPDGFRNPNWASDYSLLSAVPHVRYHRIHVNQLSHLNALTRHPVFADLADLLHVDFSPSARGQVRFWAAKHTGVRFDAGGRVTARRTTSLTRSSSAPFSHRQRIIGQPGYWYKITAGSLEGYWVQEYRSHRTAYGLSSPGTYFGPRRVELAPGTYSAYSGNSSKTFSFARASSAPVDRIGWLNGRLTVRVTAGVYRGYLLPLSGGTTLR